MTDTTDGGPTGDEEEVCSVWDVLPRTEDEKAWWAMGPFPGGTPGMIRRIRRILDVSQRGLAALVGVSQSVVARWETGRTSPRVSMMELLLDLARLEVTVRDGASGEVVEAMRDDGARNRGGSRFPAHTDLRVKGWWVPREMRTGTHAHAFGWARRSRLARDPAIGYRTSPYWKYLERTLRGIPDDHPAHHQLVVEMEWRDEVREDWRRMRRAA